MKNTAPASSAIGNRNASGYWNLVLMATGCATGAGTVGVATCGGAAGVVPVVCGGNEMFGGDCGTGFAAGGVTGGAALVWVPPLVIGGGGVKTMLDAMCAPAYLRPLKLTCQASVGDALTGSRARPSCGVPFDHAVRNGARSRVKTAFLASYFSGAFVLQSVAGAGCAEPSVPSGIGAVARHAWIVAAVSETLPALLSVVTGSVIVPLRNFAP